MAARMGDLDTLASPSTELAVVTEMHAKMVEDLRGKQILLAESWAGSEERLGSSQSSLLSKLANSAAGYGSTFVLGFCSLLALRIWICFFAVGIGFALFTLVYLLWDRRFCHEVVR